MLRTYLPYYHLSYMTYFIIVIIHVCSIVVYYIYVLMILILKGSKRNKRDATFNSCWTLQVGREGDRLANSTVRSPHTKLRQISRRVGGCKLARPNHAKIGRARTSLDVYSVPSSST